MKKTTLAMVLIAQGGFAGADDTTLGKASKVVDALEQSGIERADSAAPIDAVTADDTDRRPDDDAGIKGAPEPVNVAGPEKPQTFADLADLARSLSGDPDGAGDMAAVTLGRTAADFDALFSPPGADIVPDQPADANEDDGERSGQPKDPGAGATDHCPALPI